MDVLTLDHLQARGHMTAVATSEPHFGRDPTFAEYGWHGRVGFYHPRSSFQLPEQRLQRIKLAVGALSIPLPVNDSPHSTQKCCCQRLRAIRTEFRLTKRLLCIRGRIRRRRTASRDSLPSPRARLHRHTTRCCETVYSPASYPPVDAW